MNQAAYFGHSTCLRHLLDFKADVDVIDAYGGACVHVCTWRCGCVCVPMRVHVHVRVRAYMFCQHKNAQATDLTRTNTTNRHCCHGTLSHKDSASSHKQRCACSYVLASTSASFAETVIFFLSLCHLNSDFELFLARVFVFVCTWRG